MTNDFTLRNEPVKSKPMPSESTDRTRQQMLFSGLDCLPGQLDLFPTDGREPNDTAEDVEQS